VIPTHPLGGGGPPARPAARLPFRYADEGDLTMIPELRRARRDDVAAIAALFRLSSGGVADYVWRRLAEPGEDPLAVGIRRYAREGVDFSYENCVVADDDGSVVGMINAFPVRGSGEPASEEDPVLRPYAELEAPDSLYISGIALLPPYRGQGIGTRMMTAMRERARAEALPRLSLIAFAENVASVRLYERLGYSIVDRRAVVPHPLIQYGGDAVLMVAEA
jgi:ribosomal protein S18 acetylase RimI-like enzyme